jgi:hypothetical protein
MLDHLQQMLAAVVSNALVESEDGGRPYEILPEEAFMERSLSCRVYPPLTLKSPIRLS